jgi:hypothetical protein
MVYPIGRSVEFTALEDGFGITGLVFECPLTDGQWLEGGELAADQALDTRERFTGCRANPERRQV